MQRGERFHLLANLAPHHLAQVAVECYAVAREHLAHHAVGTAVAQIVMWLSVFNGPVQGTVVRVGHVVFNHEIECIVVDAQKFLVSRKAIFLFCVDVNHCVLFDLKCVLSVLFFEMASPQSLFCVRLGVYHFAHKGNTNYG